ncbi:hypothetical protein [Chitinasiproducens palmae]|uniref:hypothetical protein n=1 Tax=Chitinasiproducens palmae TaxID=1770053 RepID=UPI001113BA9D|nr:hypothetical protein [Chitinasiproducens palmae]
MKRSLAGVGAVMRDLRCLYALLAVALICGAGSLVGLGVWLDQLQVQRDRIAWDAERSAAAAERATLYGRINAVRLSGIEQCEAEARQVRDYYRQIAAARDAQYQQLAQLNSDMNRRLAASEKHDIEQDRRIGQLLEQNGELLRQSTRRAAAGEVIAEQTAVAAAKASEAADAAQQAVEAAKEKK